MRITNWLSWFQPWLVLVVEVSGKYPSTWMPGTPLGVTVPAACRPAQSAGLVCPVCTVPVVVRSARQAVSVRSAPLTTTLSMRAQWPRARLVGPGRGGSAEGCAPDEDEGRDGGAGEGAGATLRRAGLDHAAQPRRGADLRQCDRATHPPGRPGRTPHPPLPAASAEVAARATTSALTTGRVSRVVVVGSPLASTASTSRKVAATIAAARSASSRGRNGPERHVVGPEAHVVVTVGGRRVVPAERDEGGILVGRHREVRTDRLGADAVPTQEVLGAHQAHPRGRRPRAWPGRSRPAAPCAAHRVGRSDLGGPVTVRDPRSARRADLVGEVRRPRRPGGGIRRLGGRPRHASLTAQPCAAARLVLADLPPDAGLDEAVDVAVEDAARCCRPRSSVRRSLTIWYGCST